MINRHLSEILAGIIKKVAVITLTGPRQSGKTTLVKQCLSDFTYINLEETDKKEIALTVYSLNKYTIHGISLKALLHKENNN